MSISKPNRLPISGRSSSVSFFYIFSVNILSTYPIQSGRKTRINMRNNCVTLNHPFRRISARETMCLSLDVLYGNIIWMYYMEQILKTQNLNIFKLEMKNYSWLCLSYPHSSNIR